MFKIISKKILSSNVKQFEIDAKDIAEHAKPGQFVILRINEQGERIPLTVAATNPLAGTITIIFQEIGKTTLSLGNLSEGDFILDIVGPLGHPTKIEKYGTIIVIAGGVGAAEAMPVIKAFRKAGNKIIGIIGARNKDLLILQNEFTEICDSLYITTDDGSAGQKGFVSNVLEDIISKQTHIDFIYAIGPVPMMKAISDISRLHKIKTYVSLNPIMVDGTGMCGACRVSIDGKTRFACVEGPEFDAHKVNWDELSSRLSLYKKDEQIALDKYVSECKCRKE